MSRSSINRRHFLSALGASLVATSGARAAPPAPRNPNGSQAPLRFVGVYMPHGCAYELYKPGPGMDLGYDGCTLQPFDDAQSYGRSFKDKLVVVDHVDLTAGLEVGTVGHDAARVILTGSGAHGKNASIDQYLAAERGLGQSTAITSLVLGIGDTSSDIGANISYAAGGTPLPKLIDPSRVFDELFGQPLTGKARAELAAERAKQRSVLDFLRSDLSALRRSSAASERVKLDQHESALREIEKRLSGVRPVCQAPLPRAQTEFARVMAHGGAETHFDALTDVMIDLLARALACDMTRFATLFLADLSRTKLFPELPDDVHGAVAHRYHARDDKQPGHPDTWAQLGLQNRYTFSKIARLLQRLDESGILPDCVVYAASDMGDPARHSSRHVPTLLLGGAGGHFKMGRYLELEPTRGTPHNRILVSICQAFGVATNRFGTSASSAVVSGRLEALHA